MRATRAFDSPSGRAGAGRCVRSIAVAALLAVPAAAQALPPGASLSSGDRRPGLLDADLDPPRLALADLSASPVVLLASADAPGSGTEKGTAAQTEGASGAMDFDLLGEATPPPDAANQGKLRLRRTMLTWHQGLGFALVGLQLATTAVGQLNYGDRVGAGPDTAKYQLSHAVLAYTTLGVFVVNGAVALLAPSPLRNLKMDRVMVHRIALFTAAAGMVAQGVLGVYTRQREGYLNQDDFAKTHLAIGYVTLAALSVGVGALVF
jgi:hypothetical protein